MESKAFHIPSLDGIRTLAFLIVFFSHAGLERIVPGGFGVTIFFFLSGFLITTLLRREYHRTSSISLRGFYLRRITRIWPAFYTVLALSSAATLAGLLPGTLQPVPLLSQLLHLANYQLIFHGPEGMPAGSGVYWSLAVEEHFYLAFPLLYLLLMMKARVKPAAQAGIFLTGCLLVLAWRCHLVLGHHVDEHRTFYATDCRLDSLLFGCALAVYGNPILDPPLGSDRLWRGLLLPAGLAVLLFSLVYRHPQFRETFRYTLQGIALIPVFVAAIRFPKSLPFAIFNWKPVAASGALTYPLYLVHFTILVAVWKTVPGWHPAFQGTLAFTASVFVSWLIHRFIERPVAALRRPAKSPAPAGLETSRP
ncbi:acyltransferase [Luteolibacter sp. LG18]|uniref:acyltransferase family protein n=1 Tax=Luteolibacter sp. LG18 TaxID=2819286 RepID=UPI002B2EAF6A|nr:hypothetical protein llg_42870 [Luteolibacter sp. LG18]